MPQPVLEFLEVNFWPDTGVLVGRWLRAISPEESQQGYWHMLATAQAHACRRWLMDVRRRPRTDAATIRWLVDAFFPAAARAMGGQVMLSTLLAPSLLQELAQNPALPGTDEPPGAPFRLGRFLTEHDALAWLQATPLAPAGR